MAIQFHVEPLPLSGHWCSWSMFWHHHCDLSIFLLGSQMICKRCHTNTQKKEHVQVLSWYLVWPWTSIGVDSPVLINLCGYCKESSYIYIYVCIYTSSFRTTFARVEQLELGSIRTHRIWRSHLHFPWRNDKDVISCSKRNHLRYKKKQRKLISLHYKQQHWQCDCSSLEGTQSLDTFCMQILQTQGFLGAFQLGDIGARGIPWKHCLT